MGSASFARLATQTCSIKRLGPVPATGKRGEATTYLSGLRCTPLDPVDESIREVVTLAKPYQARQLFIEGNLQLVETDVLVYDGVDYVIRAVGLWDWPMGDGVRTTHLVVEDARVTA